MARRMRKGSIWVVGGDTDSAGGGQSTGIGQLCPVGFPVGEGWVRRNWLVQGRYVVWGAEGCGGTSWLVNGEGQRRDDVVCRVSRV